MAGQTLWDQLISDTGSAIAAALGPGESFVECLRATFKYNVPTTGSDTNGRNVVADWMYEQLTQSYVLDEANREFLDKSNPWALHGITERLLEAAQRDLWESPPPEMLDELRRISEHSDEALLDLEAREIGAERLAFGERLDARSGASQIHPGEAHGAACAWVSTRPPCSARRRCSRWRRASCSAFSAVSARRWYSHARAPAASSASMVFCNSGRRCRAAC